MAQFIKSNIILQLNKKKIKLIYLKWGIKFGRFHLIGWNFGKG